MRKISPYENYKPSGVAWLGDIPEHWEKTYIKGITRIYSEKGKPNLELLSVYRDYGVIKKASRDDNHNKPGMDLSGYKVVYPNTLVLNKMKTWQGSLGISKYKGIVSPAYITCNIHLEKVQQEFLNYLLRCKNYVFEYNRLSYGVRPSQWDMRYQDFKSILVFLPSFKEQTAIAKFLDYKLSKIDRFIRKKKQLIKLLNEQKAGIINHAVTKGIDPNAKLKPSGIDWLGDIPEHWDVRKLKYSVRLNRHTQFDDIESSYKKIALENIESKTGRILELNTNSFEGIGTIFKPGDVLFGKLRPYLAKAATPNFEGSCVNEILVLSPKKEEWNHEFLKYRMLASDFISIVDNSTYGAKMPRASWIFIGSLKLSLPPINEQFQIVKSIEEQHYSTNLLIEKIEKEIALIQEYRTALIAEAVTGKIDVRDFELTREEEESFEEMEDFDSLVESFVEEEEMEFIQKL